MPDNRERLGWAGLLGAGVALGVGELLAGLASGIASPVGAIGAVIVDRAPPWLEDFAIAVFGATDKAALAIGTVLIALGIGWAVGARSGGRPWLVPGTYGIFGLLGVLAALGEFRAVAWMVVAAAAVAVAGGGGAYLLLTRAADLLEPTDALAEDRSRRRFLAMAGATGAAALASGVVGRRLISRVPELPAVPVARSTSRVAPVGPQHDFGLPDLTPPVTSNHDFFRIDTALVVPRVDPSDWKLKVSGLVDREVEFSYDELLGMDLVEDYVTLACVSNEVGGDLVGNAAWTGVRLEDLLERAGVQAAGAQVVGRSVDDFTAGFPTEAAFNGRRAMVALAMNGEPLPAAHGFPARLVVAGLYGYVSATKWLSRIELHTWEGFNGYWIPRRWAKEAPVKTQSRIDLPAWGSEVPAGSVEFAGVAWSPLLGIEAVEIAVDGGDWLPAELSLPLSSHSWVQWRATADIPSGRHQVRVRATDGTGTPQTDRLSSPRPDGATGHDVAVVIGV